MYQIIRFTGGVYRFHELAEYLEDAGGMLVQEDRLHIARGSSFITQELQVIMIIPPDEVEHIKALAQDIKGQIEEHRHDASCPYGMDDGQIPLINMFVFVSR